MRPSTSVIVETRLGTLTCSVQDGLGEPVTDGVSIRIVPMEGHASPLGSGNFEVMAALLSITPHRDLQDLVFSCGWTTDPGIAGDPDNGEWVDAQCWTMGDKVLVVATEDVDALRWRLPASGFQEDPYPTQYLPAALETRIPCVPSGTESTLHFVIATGPGANAQEQFAVWNAADIRHQEILAIAADMSV